MIAIERKKLEQVLEALEKSTMYFNIVRLGESRLKDTEIRGASHVAITAIKEALAQPEPNKSRPLESDYTSQVAYTRALERYCDGLAQPDQKTLAKVEPCAVCGEGKARLSVLRSCDTCHSEYAGQAEMKVALAQPDYRAVKTYHEGKPVYVSQTEQELEYCADYHCAGDCGQPHNQQEMQAFLVAQPEQEPVAWMIEDRDNRHFIFRMQKPEAIVGETLTPLYSTPPKRPWVGLTEAENATCLGFNKVLGLQYQEAKLKEKNT